MGKGNRNKNNRYEEAYAMDGSAAVKAAPRSGAKKDKTTFLLIAVIAILLVASIALYVFSSSGIVDRNTIVVSSENYKVTGTMLAYYENLTYSNMFQQYYYYYYMYVYSGDANQAYNAVAQMMSQYTMADFFDDALSTSKEILVLCEEANAAGVKLEDADYDSIEEQLDSIDSFSATFGSGVKKSDVRKALELQSLASKYVETVNEKIANEVTDADVKAYVDEHKADFYKSTVLTYDLTLNASDYTDNDAKFEADKALADETVTKLAAAKDADEFKKIIAESIVLPDFELTLVGQLGDTPAPSDEVKAAALEKLIEALCGAENVVYAEDGKINDVFNKIYDVFDDDVLTALSNLETEKAFTAEEEDELGLWASSADTKLYATKTVDNSNADEYSKVVYMLAEVCSLDETPTRTVAHILRKAAREDISEDEPAATEAELAAAKAKAEEILASFKSGEQTLDAFKALAEKDGNNEDSQSVYENISASTNFVPEFLDWVMDDARKVGDTGIVQTVYGFHVMYLDSFGDPEYVSVAKEAIEGEKYSAYIEEKSASLTVNEKAVEKYSK